MTTVERALPHALPTNELPTEVLQSLSPMLRTIIEKAWEHQRLTFDEGLTLLSCEAPHEIDAICQLANALRKRRCGDVVHFASTLYIHPTNLCELSCPFCSFYAKPGWEKAWFLTPDVIEEKIKRFLGEGLTEIHIVGGLWRDCNLEYYEELFKRIKRLDANLHIKALTPVEYDFLAKHHGLSVKEVLMRMMSFGLGSLTGGGAEILVEEIRTKIAPGKISSDEYLAIHALAHKLGLKSNVTMLFGHIEENSHIIEHLCRVREVQDETHGFRAFIPLKFGEENNALGKRKQRLKKKRIELIYALSRIMLDNIPHLKVLWNYIGVELALRMLDCGGNDLSSTNFEERIIVMAGSEPVRMDAAMLSTLITSIGRTPQLTHSGAV